MLKDKKILIGVTGSIAAYKIPFLVRLLIKEGADVRLILTDAAKDFVTPLTLSTLSGHPVENKFFDATDGSWHSHIELGNWADVFLIAPVTATTLGKLSNGIADNLLVATYLAARCPIYFAPAMDLDMYHHPTTKANIDKLISFGNVLIEPTEGELASGLCGAGRLQEPEVIVKVLQNHFEKKKDFRNKKILISAGPTYEKIDPVRFIGNFSSGKMGYALAEEFAERGAKVQLVSGPVNLKLENPNIEITRVNSAKEMAKECLDRFPGSDITIMAAAVADYTVADPASEKIKKKDGDLSLQLVPTTDILCEMGKQKKKGQFLVGFALESDNEIDHAKKKLENKNLDLIVLNSLKDKGAGFGHDTNKITVFDAAGTKDSFELKSKREVAQDIANKILALRRS
jgi:phosphopantothenoylcysteine decarboxylase/phosphopantothenate--cysteine ligase